MQFIKNIILLILCLISLGFIFGLFIFNDNIFLQKIVPSSFILAMLFLHKIFGKCITRASELRNLRYLWPN